MEEKKQDTNTANNKKKQKKHHSYFLEPRAQENKNAVQAKPAEPKASESTPAAANSTQQTRQNNNQGNGQKHNKKKHKKHGGGQQAQPAAQVSGQSEGKGQSAESKPSSRPEQKNQKNQQKHGKHKPHQHSGKGEQSAEKASANDKKAASGNAGDGKLSNPLTFKPEARAVFNHDDFEEVPYNFDEEEAPVTAIEPTPVADEKSTDEQNENEPLVEVVGIRFKSNSKIYYFDPNGKKFIKGTHAIVDTARGLEYGEVALANTMIRESETVPPMRPAIRVSTPEDDAHHIENKQKEDEAFKLCNEKITQHKLDMKLIEAQYTFDNTKLLFYFSSSGRVDFRELVKDLASVFRTRIELRQIGIRDEAKLMGGLGICGRPLCCAKFLTDFGQVSIKMAKEQNLSLNSVKISGICGRLMCCLRYEQETYEYEIKRTPAPDSYVRTENGDGIVTEMSPLAGTIKVRLLATPDVPPKTYRREDVIPLRKKNGK